MSATDRKLDALRQVLGGDESAPDDAETSGRLEALRQVLGGQTTPRRGFDPNTIASVFPERAAAAEAAERRRSIGTPPPLTYEQEMARQVYRDAPFLAKIGIAAAPAVESSLSNLYAAVAATFVPPSDDRKSWWTRFREEKRFYLEKTPGVVAQDIAQKEALARLGQHAGPGTRIAGEVVATPSMFLDPVTWATMPVGGVAGKVITKSPIGRGAVAAVTRRFGPRAGTVVESVLSSSSAVGAFSGAHAAASGATAEETAKATAEGALIGGLVFGVPSGAFKALARRYTPLVRETRFYDHVYNSMRADAEWTAVNLSEAEYAAVKQGLASSKVVPKWAANRFIRTMDAARAEIRKIPEFREGTLIGKAAHEATTPRQIESFTRAGSVPPIGRFRHLAVREPAAAALQQRIDLHILTRQWFKWRDAGYNDSVAGKEADPRVPEQWRAAYQMGREAGGTVFAKMQGPLEEPGEYQLPSPLRPEAGVGRRIPSPLGGLTEMPIQLDPSRFPASLDAEEAAAAGFSYRETISLGEMDYSDAWYVATQLAAEDPATQYALVRRKNGTWAIGHRPQSQPLSQETGNAEGSPVFQEPAQQAPADVVQGQEQPAIEQTAAQETAPEAVAAPPDAAPTPVPTPSNGPTSPSKPSAAPATPLARQIARFKEKHPETVLLVKMGDFYEAFGEDARKIAQTTGLTLTTSNDGQPMAGFPARSRDEYIKRLVEAGHRVALAERPEEPGRVVGEPAAPETPPEPQDRPPGEEPPAAPAKPEAPEPPPRTPQLPRTNPATPATTPQKGAASPSPAGQPTTAPKPAKPPAAPKEPTNGEVLVETPAGQIDARAPGRLGRIPTDAPLPGLDYSPGEVSAHLGKQHEPPQWAEHTPSGDLMVRIERKGTEKSVDFHSLYTHITKEQAEAWGVGSTATGESGNYTRIRIEELSPFVPEQAEIIYKAWVGEREMGARYRPIYRQLADLAFRSSASTVDSGLPNVRLWKVMPADPRNAVEIDAFFKQAVEKIQKEAGTVTKARVPGAERKPKKPPPEKPKKRTPPAAKTETERIKSMAPAVRRTGSPTNAPPSVAPYGLSVKGADVVATDGFRAFVLTKEGGWGVPDGIQPESSHKTGRLSKKDDDITPFGDDKPPPPDLVRTLVASEAKGDPKFIISDFGNVPEHVRLARDANTLLRHLAQANIMAPPDGYAVRAGTIYVVVNKDGSLGFAARSPEAGQAEINIRPGAKPLGALNGKYLEDAIGFHLRAAPDQPIEAFWKNENRALVMRSKDGSALSATMPVQSDEPLAERISEVIGGDSEPEPPVGDAVQDMPRQRGKRPGPIEEEGVRATQKEGFIPSEAEQFSSDLFPPLLRPVQMPELLRLAKQILGTPEIKKNLGNALGAFYPGKGIIKIWSEAAQDPNLLAQVLAHELGHAIDWLPDKLVRMDRGNIWGRLKTLRNYIKNRFEGELATNWELRDELEALSAWWRGPWEGDDISPAYKDYRKKGVELWADALSVLMVSPGDLKARAPKFFDALLRSLDTKPDVLKAYLEAQDILAGDPESIAQRRRDDIREALLSAEHVMQARLEERRASRASVVEHVMQYFVDRGYPMIARGAKARHQGMGVSEENALRYSVDEMHMGNSQVRAFLTKVKHLVDSQMIRYGITTEDAHEYMVMRRIAFGDRSELANPGGFTLFEARDQLNDLRKNLGPERYAAMETAIGHLDDMVFEAAEEAVAAGIISKTKFDTAIAPNRGKYATFRVIEYIEDDEVTALVKGQIGTFKDIANAYVATIAKTIALKRLIVLQKAKRTGIDFLTKWYPDEISRVEVPRFHRPPPPKKGKDHIPILEKGYWAFYEVDKYIARVYGHPNIQGLEWASKIMGMATYKVFHPLYVSLSPGWQALNIWRDLKRTYKNLAGTGTGAPPAPPPGIQPTQAATATYKVRSLRRGRQTTEERSKADPSLREVLRAYMQAIPEAWHAAGVKPSAVVQAMQEASALDAPFHLFDAMDPDSTQYQRLMERYGLPTTEAMRRKVAGMGPFAFIERLAVAQELVPKIATWEMMGERGIDDRRRAYIVRNFVGTPNTSRRGLLTFLTNPLFMYSNVKLQGLRADAEVATKPSSRSGYWMRSVMMDFLPKWIMRAAVAGVLGATVKEFFDLVSEYDKTNYIIIPMGWIADGEFRPIWDKPEGQVKAAYLRIPHDDTSRMLAGIFWHASKGEAPETVQAAFGELPTLSPPIELGLKWLQYARGHNPYDEWRGRTVIPQDAWEAGGWYATDHMIRYTVNQFGVASDLMEFTAGQVQEGLEAAGVDAKALDTLSQPPSIIDEQDTWMERTITSIPGLSRIVRTTDRGIDEERWEEIELEEKESARFRLGLPREVRSLVKERYRLNRWGEDRLAEKEADRRRDLNIWYRTVYLPITKRIKRADEEGWSKADRDAEMQDLSDRSADFLP